MQAASLMKNKFFILEKKNLDNKTENMSVL